MAGCYFLSLLPMLFQKLFPRRNRFRQFPIKKIIARTHAPRRPTYDFISCTRSYNHHAQIDHAHTPSTFIIYTYTCRPEKFISTFADFNRDKARNRIPLWLSHRAAPCLLLFACSTLPPSRVAHHPSLLPHPCPTVRV